MFKMKKVIIRRIVDGDDDDEDDGPATIISLLDQCERAVFVCVLMLLFRWNRVCASAMSTSVVLDLVVPFTSILTPFLYVFQVCLSVWL